MKVASEHQLDVKNGWKLKALAWGLVGAVVLLILLFFNITPADIAHGVTRCLRCH